MLFTLVFETLSFKQTQYPYGQGEGVGRQIGKQNASGRWLEAGRQAGGWKQAGTWLSTRLAEG